MLVDRQWFLGDNLLNKVYPRSPLQLFYDYIENKYTDTNKIKTWRIFSFLKPKKILGDVITTITTELIKNYILGS
jgi:hypothetical protein